MGSNSTNTLGHIFPSTITIRPERDRFAISGQRLQFSKGCRIPNAIAEDRGDDDGLFVFVALQCAFHFNIVTIIRRDEISADQQENDIRLFKVLVDFLIAFLSGKDAAVVPRGNDILTLQKFQMGFQFIAQGFIFMRITVKQADRFPFLFLLIRPKLPAGIRQVHTIEEIVNLNLHRFPGSPYGEFLLAVFLKPTRSK